MKILTRILTVALLMLASSAVAQNPLTINQVNQYGVSRGGFQIDSAFCFPVKDTVNPFVHYGNMRKVGRAYLNPFDFRLYVFTGLWWKPINTFTAALESKLAGVATGATANSPDAHLLNRANHVGTQPYTTIAGLASVAHSGNYVDLMGRPDMSSFMLYSDTTGRWRSATWTPSFSQVRNAPTTVAGYGITDIFPSQAGQAGKVLSSNGSTVQWSSVKRQESYQATTDASGLVTITYSSAFGSIPNVQPSFVSTNPRESFTLESSSVTGCTVRVILRSDVVGLLPTYSNVSGRNVKVLVTQM